MSQIVRNDIDIDWQDCVNASKHLIQSAFLAILTVYSIIRSLDAFEKILWKMEL